MTLSKIKGPKTHFSKLRDQNMIFSKVKRLKTYFSLKTNLIYGVHENVENCQTSKKK